MSKPPSPPLRDVKGDRSLDRGGALIDDLHRELLRAERKQFSRIVTMDTATDPGDFPRVARVTRLRTDPV